VLGVLRLHARGVVFVWGPREAASSRKEADAREGAAFFCPGDPGADSAIHGRIVTA
jgi:hypothetical protein